MGALKEEELASQLKQDARLEKLMRNLDKEVNFSQKEISLLKKYIKNGRRNPSKEVIGIIQRIRTKIPLDSCEVIRFAGPCKRIRPA